MENADNLSGWIARIGERSERDWPGIIEGVILFVVAVQPMHKVFINVARGHVERSRLSPLLSHRASAKTLFRFLSRSQHAADNG